MSSTPARRAVARERDRNETPDKAELPSLGDWLRKVREHRKHSRRSAEVRTGVSYSYIKKIENGQLVPLRGVLDQLIVGYRLDAMQARHTRELAEPAIELAPIEELRERIATPDRLAALRYFDQVNIICVFTDPLWNVLVGNESFHRAEPDLEAAGNNVALWHFRPDLAESPAKDIALQWDYEAAAVVALIRAGLGRYRDSPQSIDLLERLRASVDFNRRWQDGIQVAYGREPDDLCHMIDPVSREPFSVSIQVSELPDTRDVRFHLAFQRPYAGPPLA